MTNSVTLVHNAALFHYKIFRMTAGAGGDCQIVGGGRKEGVCGLRRFCVEWPLRHAVPPNVGNRRSSRLIFRRRQVSHDMRRIAIMRRFTSCGRKSDAGIQNRGAVRPSAQSAASASAAAPSSAAPQSAAAPLRSPAAERTMAQKVARVKEELSLDPSLPVAKAVAEANAAMGIEGHGTLAQQVDLLLTELGVLC